MANPGFTPKKNTVKEKSKMHYVEYNPGTIARITEHPTAHGSKDVNRLSSHVVEFNQYLKENNSLSSKDKLWAFEKKFLPFKLPFKLP